MTLNVQTGELKDDYWGAPLGLLEVTGHEVNLSQLTYFYVFSLASFNSLDAGQEEMESKISISIGILPGKRERERKELGVYSRG